MLDLESTEPWLPLATGTADSSAIRVFWVFGSPANMPYPTARCLVPAVVSSPAPPPAPSTLGLIGSQQARRKLRQRGRRAIHDRPVLDQLWLSRPGSDRMN